MSSAAPVANPPVGLPVPKPLISLRRVFSVRRTGEALIRWVLFACALVSVVTTAAIIFVLFYEAVLWIPWQPAHKPFFGEVSVREFLTETRWTPQFAEKHFGILPLLIDTLLITVIAGLI